jgi:hypothetical protein
MNLADKKAAKSLNKKFKCDQCNLQFSSLGNLANHKKKSCTKTNAPSQSKPEDVVNQSVNESRVDEQLEPEQISHKKKVLEDLYNYKSKKSVEQSVRDIEDLIIRDTIRYRKLNTNEPPVVVYEPAAETVNTGGYQYQQIINEVTNS